MLVNCKNCNKEFFKRQTEAQRHPNHFCCRSCAASFNNKGKHKNPPKPRTCLACKIIFYNNREHYGQKYCKGCQGQYYESLDDNGIKIAVPRLYTSDSTLQEIFDGCSVKNKHPSWKSALVRVSNRAKNKALLSLPCAKCGYNLHVELAHIKAISSFLLETPLSIVNHSDNVVQLCPNCHWELDHGKYSISKKDGIVTMQAEGVEPTWSVNSSD